MSHEGAEKKVGKMKYIIPELLQLRGVIESIGLPFVIVEFPTSREADASRFHQCTREPLKKNLKRKEKKRLLQKIIEGIKKIPKEGFIV